MSVLQAKAPKGGRVMDCTNLKAGDMIWIGRTERPGQAVLKKIQRITDKQVIVPSMIMGALRFKRSDGSSTNAHVLTRILKVATPEEIAAWDAKMEESNKQRERDAATHAKYYSEQIRLANLLHVSGYQIGISRDKGGLWLVEFKGMTTKQVECLAVEIMRGK
jgi:hypothetical protein